MKDLVALFIPIGTLIWVSVILVYYRQNRKWPKDRYKGKMAWLQENIIEIFLFLMFVAIAVPEWGSLFLKK